MRAARALSRNGSARTAARAAPAASASRSAAVSRAATASSACMRSWRQSSFAMTAQSSYHPGSRSSDRAATAAPPMSASAPARRCRSTGCAKARAYWTSTISPSARPSSSGVTRTARRVGPEARHRRPQAGGGMFLGGLRP